MTADPVTDEQRAEDEALLALEDAEDAWADSADDDEQADLFPHADAERALRKARVTYRAKIAANGERANRDELRAALSHVEGWMARALAAEAEVAASRARIALDLSDEAARWLWEVLIGASWGHVSAYRMGADNFDMAQELNSRILLAAGITTIEQNGHGRVVRAALSPAAPEPVSAPYAEGYRAAEGLLRQRIADDLDAVVWATNTLDAYCKGWPLPDDAWDALKAARAVTDKWRAALSEASAVSAPKETRDAE